MLAAALQTSAQLCIPLDAIRPASVLIIGTALSQEQRTPERDGPNATGTRWRFQVKRTLDGTDVTGDTVTVVAERETFKVGTTYIMHLLADGVDASADRFVEATPQAIESEEDKLRKSGAVVHSKLRLWGYSGDVFGTAGLKFYVRDDGSFRYEIWKSNQARDAESLEGYEGHLTKDQVAALAKAFEDARESRPPADGFISSGVGWRDREGHLHSKPTNTTDGREEFIFDIIHRAVVEHGKPISPTTQRATTKPAG
jgi:hypothetical protein